MSKIVLVFVIIALACVNAQEPNKGQETNNAQAPNIAQELNKAQAAAIAGAPGFLGVLIPRFTPEDLFKAAANSGQDLHASFMSQTSQGGKTVTTLRRNDNGVVKEQQFTN